MVRTLGRCRDCGAPIRWGRKPNGKGIPLDPEPDEAGRFVFEDDRSDEYDDRPEIPVRYVPRDELETVEGVLFQTHFDTCEERNGDAS